MTRLISHFINGESVADSRATRAPVYNPSTGAVQAELTLGDESIVAQAVEKARAAFPAWAGLTPQKRARVMFAFKSLLEREMDSLAVLLASEHGKIVDDAKSDIQRGLEAIEFACGVPHLMKGEHSMGVGPGIDMYSLRQPLGVVAGITPFNFPAMIPMWMFGLALACGNCFVLKPSEKDPSVPMRLAELLMEAGLPPGVLQIVHGAKPAVDAILAHPAIDAVSFVGSSAVAEYVYARAAQSGKRVQAMGGAKNHALILPDADMERAADALIGAAYGSAGERCMAVAVAVPVGEDAAQKLLPLLAERVQRLKPGPSQDAASDFGPLVTAAHKERVERYIAQGAKEGADLLVDGRGFALQGYEKGFFLGGSLFDRVTPAMASYQEEIFGPVLQIVRADNLEDALALPSRHPYGNGVAIFTRDGGAARRFAAAVNVGMVGINVPIPVPLSYYTFGGWKRSAFGDTNQHGTDGVKFWTKIKTITARWPDAPAGEQSADGSAFVLPRAQ